VDKNFAYGRLYSEIANGFSKESVGTETFYFKHPSLAEHFNIHSNYELILKEAQQRGLYTEKYQIETAISGGWWSAAKESEMNMLRKTISNLIKTKNKLVLPSQKDSIDSQIRRNEAILLTFIKERKDVVNYTAEDFAHERFLDETVILLTYKNAALTRRAFTTEEYYDLSDASVEKIRGTHTNNLILFSHLNIKHVAATGFFQNLVYLEEGSMGFWGKSASECTKYQIDLLVYGKMYKNLIKNYAENGKPVEDEITSDPEKFIQWVDNKSNGEDNKSSIIAKRASKVDGANMVSSHVGATSEDLNKMGVKIEKLGGKSLLEIAREKGGTIEKFDYLNARDNL